MTVMFCLFIGQNVFAQKLNVRNKPSTSGKIIGKLSEGDSIKVLSVTGSWAKFIYKSQNAYVFASYLEPVVEVVLPQPVEVQAEVDTTPVVQNNISDTIYVADQSSQELSNIQEIENNDSDTEWRDYTVTINTDSKVYGFMVGAGMGNTPGYFNWGVSFSSGFSTYSSTLGIGAHCRTDNDQVMFTAAIFPYIGILAYEKSKFNEYTHVKDTEQKTKFLWGAAANARVGIKLYTTKKGTSGYLTLGYYISAPEFKTEDMFDNGSWCLGLSTKF